MNLTENNDVNGGIALREVRALPSLMRWRAEVIRHVFGVVPSKRLLVANRAYYRRHMADGSHIAVEAVDENSIDDPGAGCGAICLTEELPSPDNPSGRCAYLMNIYVRGPYRGRGVGHAIVRWLVRKARALGCDKIYLETTPEARRLYESEGFAHLNGIMKYADIHNLQS